MAFKNPVNQATKKHQYLFKKIQNKWNICICYTNFLSTLFHQSLKTNQVEWKSCSFGPKHLKFEVWNPFWLNFFWMHLDEEPLWHHSLTMDPNFSQEDIRKTNFQVWQRSSKMGHLESSSLETVSMSVLPWTKIIRIFSTNQV